MQDLGVSSGQVGLLVTVFTLPGSVLTPVLGVLSDRYGRKRILVPALLLCVVAMPAAPAAAAASPVPWPAASSCCWFCPSLQGMGAAALGTLNVTVIGDIYGGRERAAALGYNSSVLSAGTASYPVIGDALARFGWFYPFALPLVAIPVGIFAVFSLRNPEPESEQGLKEYFRSTRWHLPDRAVVGLVGVSLLTLVALLGPQFSYLPILMNDRFDAPTHVIGGVLSGAALTTALVSSQLDRLTGCPTGRLTGRFSEKTLLRSAFLLHAAGLILVAVTPTLLLLRIPRRCSSASPGAATSRTSSPS